MSFKSGFCGSVGPRDWGNHAILYPLDLGDHEIRGANFGPCQAISTISKTQAAEVNGHPLAGSMKTH